MSYKVEFVGGYMDGEQMTIPELKPEIIFPVLNHYDYSIESGDISVEDAIVRVRVYRLDKKKFINGEFVYFYKFVGVR